MKKLLAITIALTCCIATQSFAQKKEALIEKILGTWHFSHYYDLGTTPDQPKRIPDTCTVILNYTFKEDGTAVVESADKSICRMPPQFYWTLVRLHDSRGKEFWGIRLTVDKMPERESYDANTWNDIILMVVQSKKKFICWVRKPQYKPASVKQQSVYKRL